MSVEVVEGVVAEDAENGSESRVVVVVGAAWKAVLVTATKAVSAMAEGMIHWPVDENAGNMVLARVVNILVAVDAYCMDLLDDLLEM